MYGKRLIRLAQISRAVIKDKEEEVDDDDDDDDDDDNYEYLFGDKEHDSFKELIVMKRSYR